MGLQTSAEAILFAECQIFLRAARTIRAVVLNMVVRGSEPRGHRELRGLRSCGVDAAYRRDLPGVKLLEM
jgi:hypothetical protein